MRQKGRREAHTECGVLLRCVRSQCFRSCLVLSSMSNNKQAPTLYTNQNNLLVVAAGLRRPEGAPIALVQRHTNLIVFPWLRLEVRCSSGLVRTRRLLPCIRAVKQCIGEGAKLNMIFPK